MLETGQPLHAFDFDKIKGRKIIVRKAKKGEEITTFDEKSYCLDQDILIIADAKKPIAIAGIKGGKETGIDKNTKTVVLESANFNQGIIRKGSRKLNLKTDAATRFEQGIDPNLTEFAINRACYLIQKISKGKIAHGLADIYPKKALPKRIRLDLDYVERLLGIKIPEREIKSILEKLRFKLKTQNLKLLDVEIPTFRLDISLQEDLIEEIARIYGYEKIKPVFPIVSLIPFKRNLEIFWEGRAKDILEQARFSEVYNYSFISKGDAKNFGGKINKLIEIENPSSIEHRYLRPSLIPNLLKNIEKNFRQFQKIKIFELGKIFQAPKLEKRTLSGVMTGDAFYQVKGVIDLLLSKLGISNIQYCEHRTVERGLKSCWWQPPKCAEIKINGEQIGFLGEVSFRVLSDLKIELKTIVFDIDFEKLVRFCSEEKTYQPISRYPSAIRDIAVLVPKRIKVNEVLNKINAVKGQRGLIKDVDLFDVYEGRNIPNNKKNFAFHIIYQAENKTLSSKEIDDAHQKIVKALEERKGWEVRKRTITK